MDVTPQAPAYFNQKCIGALNKVQFALSESIQLASRYTLLPTLHSVPSARLSSSYHRRLPDRNDFKFVEFLDVIHRKIGALGNDQVSIFPLGWSRPGGGFVGGDDWSCENR